MLWLRTFNPARTPAHWTDLVRPGQYAVFIFDARSHVARDADGRPFQVAETASIALCETLDEAADFAQEVVSGHPELCCEIYDHEGKSKDPVETVYNPGERHKYEGLRYHQREVYLGGPAVAAGIALVILDYHREFTWMWGYVIGLKLIMSGGFALLRGLIGWYECRAEASVKSRNQTA